MVAALALIGLFGGLIALIVVLVRYGKKKNKQKLERYRDLGLKLGLEYSESKHFFIMVPHLGGTRKGKRVEIFEQIVGSDKNQQVYSNVKIYNSHNFQFKIGKEHLFSKMGKALGLKDIEFDNFELDKKFLFKSKDEGQFRTLMDYQILQDLMQIESDIVGTIHNDAGVLSYSVLGDAGNDERMRRLVSVFHFMEKLAAK